MNLNDKKIKELKDLLEDFRVKLTDDIKEKLKDQLFDFHDKKVRRSLEKEGFGSADKLKWGVDYVFKVEFVGDVVKTKIAKL